MKKEKKRKKRGVWHYIGGTAFVASMCGVRPVTRKKGSDYLYSKKQSLVKSQDEDWRLEIVKKRELEDAEDGEI